MHVAVAVVGPGEDATEQDVGDAFHVGARLARAGFAVLTGGRAAGVMDAALRGARDAGGFTVGILPGSDSADVSPAVQLPIVTGIGEARGQVLVLSARALVVCGINPGTAVEVALALKLGRPVILLRPSAEARAFWQALGEVQIAATPDEAVAHVVRLVDGA